MRLLHIDSSVLGTQSASRHLTADTVAAWVATYPGTEVDRLDLATDAPGHLGADALHGFASPAEAARSERYLQQFLAADVVVVGAPMYNFSVPSQLKAWIDRIAQAGRTFRYTPNGPEGLVRGKTVVVASTRGGRMHGLPHEGAMDHQEAYLRAVFGFLGVQDIRFVRAEGLSMGPDARAQAMDAAQAAIARAAHADVQAVPA